MSEEPFDTPLALSGSFRSPKQMLARQEYGLEREIVALGETRRTEWYWVKTLVS